MLDYSKANADVLEPSVAPVVLADVIRDAVDLVTGTAREHEVRIEFRRDSVSEAEVMADRRHLVQVIVNLLSNAVKYGGRSTTVAVAVTVADRVARCSITDEGPGVPADQQRRVFEPFERLDNAGNVPGAGLGLAIAASFLRAMGGAIELESRPGEGATFTVVVPLATVPADPSGDAPAVDALSHLILYVEDEPLNASLVESIIGLLADRSLHVEPTVAGGIAALQRLHPSLILLDLNLPDGSGFDVLRAVREHPQHGSTPVFILSADATEQATSRATELGADRFITKPFNVKEFVELVESYS
jgi:CheY-like chemotaxis protein/anti-sigma regulatory factor (Ser/Thr protein kinase)